MNMEPNDHDLQKDIDTVIAVLPPVIRAYLAQGKYTAVAKGLMSKYGLRIDQGGVLEREIMLLLMGVETPDEFTQALIEEAKLSQQVVNSIMQDINAQIFVPLRKEEEEKGIATVPEPVRAIEGVRPVPPPSSAANRPQVTAPVAPQRVVAGPATLAQAIENALDAKAKMAQSPMRPNSVHGAPLPPKVILPTMNRLPMSKPMGADSMLEDHEEKHIDFTAPQMPPVAPVPSRMASAPPPNLPGAMPVVPAPTLPPKMEFRTPLPITPPKPAPLPSNTSYAMDPYREPVDEETPRA